MSQHHDINPDSEECQQMTRDNERAVFAAQMEARHRAEGFKKVRVLCRKCGADAVVDWPVTLSFHTREGHRCGPCGAQVELHAL